MSQPLRISVVVPTFRRAKDLNRCLLAMQKLKPPADELIVVRRDNDLESAATIEAFASSEVKTAVVQHPGVIAAMNAGCVSATGDVIALTDDDAVPWGDWLERIELAFLADARLGCIGGKDWQYKGDPLTLDDGVETRAGEMQWWGRVIGDHHHAAVGPAREVEVVKGVNVAFRAKALREVGGFDTRLRGAGAQVHWELAVCLAMKSKGWKVVFDPSLGVDHFPSQRFDEDQRNQFNSIAQRNMVFNETLILCNYFHPARRLVFLLWALLIGTRGAPGIAQIPRLLTERRPHVFRRWFATLTGRWDGWKASFAGINVCLRK